MTDYRDIERLIERYFEAQTSEEEERELRRILADPSTPATQAVEEARAVVGYTSLQGAIARHDTRAVTKRWKSRPSRWIRVATATAAAVAAIAIATDYTTRHSGEADSETVCLVYAEGKATESQEEAIAIMHAQLASIGRATQNNPATDALNMLEAMNNDH